MNETEETIKILDRLAGHAQGFYVSGRYEDDGNPQWYLPNGADIRLKRGFFFVLGDGIPRGDFRGFDLLEYLAERFPDIAAKLAEPTK